MTQGLIIEWLSAYAKLCGNSAHRKGYDEILLTGGVARRENPRQVKGEAGLSMIIKTPELRLFPAR